MISRETKQKNEMQKTIDSIDGFFSAEEVYGRLKTIGIATIYRFLKSESKLGRLHVYNCSGKTLYSKNKNSHCHFICTVCKRQTHIKMKDANFLKSITEGKPCHFQLDVYGVCEACKDQKKE